MTVGVGRRIGKRVEERSFDVEGIRHLPPHTPVMTSKGDLVRPAIELSLEVVG